MPLELAKIRALCFDVDGTLSDTDDQMVGYIARLLNPVRLILPRINPQPLARRIVMGIEYPGNFLYSLSDRLGVDHHLAGFMNAFHKLVGSGRPGSFLLIEGVKEMIARLEGYYPMAVVSARGERTTRAFLDYFELTPYFRVIITGQTCRYTKPHPDPILWAAKNMGVPPTACLMIGDTTVDIRAGKAAGAQTVGVLCGFGEEEELVRAGADLILPTTPGLMNVLQGEY